MAKPVLLTVDDDPDVLRAIERDLRTQYGAEYRVISSDSPMGALDLLKGLKVRNDGVALLLADQRIELDNVRFAVRWAESMLEHPAIVSAADVLIGFRNVWFEVGREMEFRTIAFSLLERLDETERPALVGRLIHGMAGFLTGPELLELSERAIPLLVAAGHGRGPRQRRRRGPRHRNRRLARRARQDLPHRLGRNPGQAPERPERRVGSGRRL